MPFRRFIYVIVFPGLNGSEWDDGQHHHVLLTKPQSISNMTWDVPLDEKDHPEMILGHK